MKNFNMARFTKQRGVSLVELMVALVIGLVVSLAVYTVLTTNEGRKRTITSTNDIDQVGVYASYQLDRAIRSAGSGFSAGLNPRANATTPAAMYAFGCTLNVSSSGNALIPKSGAFTAPFASVPQALHLAPVVIVDGSTSAGDVIIAAQGSAGLSESVNNLVAAATSGAVTLRNVVGFRASDKMLLVGTNADSTALAGAPCFLEQVSSSFAPVVGNNISLNLDTGSGYYLNPSSFSQTTIALNMGATPNFNMYAVGSNNVLMKYDLLLPESNGTNPSEFADSIYSLQAVYAVNNAGVTTWESPTGAYSASSLLDGSAAANQKLQNIKAVRIAIVTRTNLLEKEVVSPTKITLFSSIGKDTDVSLSDQHYRYKVTETSIPVRNALAL
jgi:type IV pilus assembly protein PilW